MLEINAEIIKELDEIINCKLNATNLQFDPPNIEHNTYVLSSNSIVVVEADGAHAQTASWAAQKGMEWSCNPRTHWAAARRTQQAAHCCTFAAEVERAGKFLHCCRLLSEGSCKCCGEREGADYCRVADWTSLELPVGFRTRLENHWNLEIIK